MADAREFRLQAGAQRVAGECRRRARREMQGCVDLPARQRGARRLREARRRYGAVDGEQLDRDAHAGKLGGEIDRPVLAGDMQQPRAGRHLAAQQRGKRRPVAVGHR